jgi:hypothetical protein
MGLLFNVRQSGSKANSTTVAMIELIGTGGIDRLDRTTGFTIQDWNGYEYFGKPRGTG